MRRSRPGRLPRRSPRAIVLIVVLLVGAAALWWTAHQRASEVEVYFVRFDAARKGSLAAVRRPAPRGTLETRLASALGDLLAGPSPSGRGNERAMITEIPPGTALLGVRVGGGIATVNLSKAYAAGGGSTSMLARVWQVVYTATQFPDAPAAQILIDGHRVEALGGEGVLIGAPLRRSAAPPSF
jgi:germination protein M